MSLFLIILSKVRHFFTYKDPILPHPRVPKGSYDFTLLKIPVLSSFINCVHGFFTQSNLKNVLIEYFKLRFSTSSAVGSAAGSNHVKMWTAERIVAILNVPALGLPFLFTTPLTDAIFCTVLVVHFHWGKSMFVTRSVKLSKYSKFIFFSKF